MSIKFLCGLMVFVLLASNIGSAEDADNNQENSGTGDKDEGRQPRLAEQFAFAGAQIEYLFEAMAQQITELTLKVETLKDAIKKYTGVEPAPEPGLVGGTGGNEEPVGNEGPGPEPGTLGGRSTLQRLAKLLVERKLSDQKESKINTLRRMLEPLQ